MLERLETSRHSVYRRPTYNLFFAIKVTPLVADEISNLFDGIRTQYRLRKNLISAPRLHVSLFGILAADFIPTWIVKSSMLAGSAIRFEEFDLLFNRLLSFQTIQEEKPLVLTADHDSTHSVNRLSSAIRKAYSALSEVPIQNRSKITPHITLAWEQHVVPAQAIVPIKLPVSEIALILSHVGQSRYETLGSWPLVPCG